MKKIIYLLILLFCSVAVYASDFEKPMSGRMVSDYAGVFNSSQLDDIENQLRIFNDTSSTQIAILTVNDLKGYAPSEYATCVAEEWGVGNKGKDNGVLMLIKPKNDTKGEIFIAVGYGLEGVIPDAIVKRIIEKGIIPYFRQNDYYSGAKSGVNNLIALASGEFKADAKQDAGGFGGSIFIVVVIFLIFVAIMSSSNKGNSETIGDDEYNKHNRGMGIPPIFFGTGGRSGGSGFGGGGFGGFGGGGFGGGGAGGSW